MSPSEIRGVTTAGIEVSHDRLRERPYALRFRPGTPDTVVYQALSAFNQRLNARLPGAGAIMPKVTLEPDPSNPGSIVEAYHLHCDAVMYRAFMSRGEAIVVDDVIELASEGTVEAAYVAG